MEEKYTAVMARSSKRKRKKWQARLGGPGPRGSLPWPLSSLPSLRRGWVRNFAFPLLSAKLMTALSIQA